ncbi:hypothetical protein [Flavobacterium sp.]|uniref:hypothetical protein n=1 Tax=Flavobacterium sp. TaxID=239 RepID=UPI00334257BC
MKNILYKYTSLSIIVILITNITKLILKFDKLVYSSLAEKLTQNQIEEYLLIQDKWEWVSYIIIPILILIKTLIIASAVYTAVFFFNRNKISFKSILNVVFQAEFVFLLVPVLKIIWFCFFETNYTLEDLQYFYPLSALNIVGYTGLEPWLIYPLQILNLFELAYIFYLAYLIGKLTSTHTDNGFKMMMYSYVPTMMLWVFVVMFLTLSMS